MPRVYLVTALLMAACDPAPRQDPASIDPPVSTPQEPVTERPHTLVTARSLRRSTLELWRDGAGDGHLRLRAPEEEPVEIPCDVLTGAWGLWVDDVDGDGRAEAIVALHKPARFDARPANRLHVYGFEHGRCVPAWRGTRLAGRFDGVATDPDDRGALWVHEWLSPTRRRVALYRWQGFGYRVERVAWEGQGGPPPALVSPLDFGPSPISPASRGT